MVYTKRTSGVGRSTEWMTTGRQVGILLDITVFLLFEWLIVEIMRMPVAAVGGRKYGLIAIMVAVAILWGGPLAWLFVRTRFTLWAYFAFVTWIACFMAVVRYFALNR